MHLATVLWDGMNCQQLDENATMFRMLLSVAAASFDRFYGYKRWENYGETAAPDMSQIS